MGIAVASIIVGLTLLFIFALSRSSATTNAIEIGSVPDGCERVNIDDFIRTYIKGASIPEHLFIELERKSLAGQTYADIPKKLITQVKQNLERHMKTEKELFDCANLNNTGIEQEKSGDIDGAISTYERNTVSGYPATHSYERLMILYRKRKEYDKEIAVIERAIDVFSLANEKRAASAIKENPSKAGEINDALKSCTMVYGNTISTVTGKPMVCFNPYDVNKYRKRLEKAKLLKERANK